MDVVGVEVACGLAVGVCLDVGVCLEVHGKACVDDECAAGGDERGVFLKAFDIGLVCAVDVEVVGVDGGYYGGVGGEVVEGAVVFVGFYHHVGAFGG